MLAYHDASAGFGGIDRDGNSSYNDYHSHNGHRPRNHELDEIETSKTRQCLKKTTKFLFSHIGLVGLVVVYAVAGGFLFQLLEERQEKYNCQEAYGDQVAQINQLKQTLVSYVQQNTTTLSSTTTGKDNTTIAFAKIGSMLYNYRSFVIQATTKYRYYGDDCSVTNKWTFANSLLFAITIITTIGYGNITPVTWEGQLCCICYATIGIPIFLLCVANISGVLGEMFRFIYARIICGPCILLKKRRAAAARRARLEEEHGINVNHANAAVWSANDENQKNPVKKSISPIKIDEEPEDIVEKYQRVAVPLTVTMIIIAAYIWIGSALFHSFEGWSMIQSGYFCFITLSTIGFGDFVPGQRKDDPHASAKLILGAIYVLFGMAILAMCFDLMQEEIVAKFRWLGTKVGIIEKEEDMNNQIDPMAENKDKRYSEISASINDPNGTMKMRRSTTVDSESISPTQTNANTTRKSSPRNNIARIHPVEYNGSNEATLHQRIASGKSN
ncbi:unnamed protein product [Adineta steineri]|uniref:Potassium channel domain-containing protein n=1 Tax=Adineta steineri TaxID=433720 RepID=A0A819NMT6_9BILA|nr:unnamed protein product [Adineta steineri]CAF3997381.1 unnamed protein product [Adineta steineri]